MTVFEVCVKVPKYMNAWGLNFHLFFGYPEATNQHPQVHYLNQHNHEIPLKIDYPQPPLLEFKSFLCN